MSYVSFLMYHDVRDPERSRWPKRYTQRSFIGNARLAADLDAIQDHYTVISIREALAGLAGTTALPANPAVLTFDDGLRDHATTAMPMLVQRGLSGCFFLPSRPIAEGFVMPAHKIQFILGEASDMAAVVHSLFALLDERREEAPMIPANDALWAEYSHSTHAGNHWPAEMVFVTRLLRTGLHADIRSALVDALFHRYVTVDEADFAADLYLRPHQVAQLVDANQDVGGHGTASFNLCLLSDAERRAEIQGAWDFLMAQVPAYVAAGPTAFSYPHGGHDAKIEALLVEAGFASGLTTEKRVASASDSLYHLPRFDGAQDRPWPGGQEGKTTA